MKKDYTKYNFEKGNAGEDLIRDFLRDLEYRLTSPPEGKAHPFDNIALKWTFPPDIRAVDIKTFPRRRYYDDTGINFTHYLTYKTVNDTIPFYLIFVDDIEKKVYGNKLSELLIPISRKNKTYPSIEGENDKKKIYFPLSSMELYFTLDDEFCEKLRSMSNSNFYNQKIDLFKETWKSNTTWIK